MRSSRVAALGDGLVVPMSISYPPGLTWSEQPLLPADKISNRSVVPGVLPIDLVEWHLVF